MPAKITLEVVKGSQKGEKRSFEEHDTLIFGRDTHCHIKMPDDDTTVSRSHFLLELNPPDARIRDLGSLNGTYVNDIKHGGRETGETPEQGAKKRHPEVNIKNGDRIKAGNTEFMVKIETPITCSVCHNYLGEHEQALTSGIAPICQTCKKKLLNQVKEPVKPPAPKPVVCQKCGKDVSKEIGAGRKGDIICQSCQDKMLDDPKLLVEEIINRFQLNQKDDNAPQLTDYIIGKSLGVGGFGAVFQAQRKKDNQTVAIKVMLARVAVEEEFRKVFLREIDTHLSLKHKNIVLFHEKGSEGGVFYFVMDFCNGGSVMDLMIRKNSPLSLSEAKPIMLDCLEGLAFAHSKSIIHRDLKPANILLKNENGRTTALICDMGLSKNFEKAGLSGFTQTGSKAGTPVFMPKEQAINFKYVKPVSDVWSIGASFYVMLTGQLPRASKQGDDIWQAILSNEIIPIRKWLPDLPYKVAEVIDRSLVVNTKDRYQDAGEYLKALQAVL